MTSEEIQILKTDARGRVKVPRGRREEILAEYDGSGLSAPQFAKLTGIKYQTFASWLHKRRVQSQGAEVAAAPTNPMRWLEAVVNPAARGTRGLAVHLPNGGVMKICDARQVELAAALIRALSKAC